MQQTIDSIAEIAIRAEKLRFLADELAVAAELCASAANADMARMIARHVTVRIADFIDHARQLRNGLPASAVAQGFKETLNALNDEFQANLALARHKLGAHVQDMDFAERLDLWVAIDAGKVAYFAEGARELWDRLGALGVPGHQPFATPSALADPSVASALAYLSSTIAVPVTIGTDPLADVRTNTTTLFNGTPIHQRAGQLALLRRWIRDQRELLALFQPSPAIARILRARLLTDVVSFHDCLITRAVQPGAAQALEGLDDLITSSGHEPTAIRAFVSSNRQETTIEPARLIRNRIGAHLDCDPTTPLATLVGELDRCDLEAALRHFAALEATFLRTCRDVVFLLPHLTDGMVIPGVLVRHPQAAPFDPARPDRIAAAPPRNTFSQAEMRDWLEQWSGGQGIFAREALDYFREAFAHAPEAEMRERIEERGSSRHFHRLTMRTSHLFLRDALLSCAPAEEEGILHLAATCRGYPTELAEILTQYHDVAGRPASPALLMALGNTVPWWLEKARRIVEAAIGTGSDRILARTMLLRIFLREEGLRRMNGQPGHLDWKDVRGKITEGADPAEELAVAIALAGTFLERPVGTYIGRLQSEYRELADHAFAAARGRLAGTLDPERGSTLQRLLRTGDLAQATLLTVTTGPRGHASSMKDSLLRAFGAGLIITKPTAEEGAAAAECLLLLGDPWQAIDVLERVSRGNPADARPQIRIAELLQGIDGGSSAAREKLAAIRSQFSLDPDGDARLLAIEARLSASRVGCA